jgi:hypothetical protein
MMDQRQLPKSQSCPTRDGSTMHGLTVMSIFKVILIVCCCSQVAISLQQYLHGNYHAENANDSSFSLPAALSHDIHDDNDNLPLATYPPSPKRFHELLDNITEVYASHELYHTAFSDASKILYNETHFFHPIRKCESTCCAETVAISLDQDDRHIKNTLDGTDMADVYLQNNPNAAWIHFFGSILDADLLPCLQPGTIIHIETHLDLLQYFFNGLRPNITVPYVIITTESDWTSPPPGFQQKLSNDNLMLKWFGINPSTRDLTSEQNEKFQGMPLGLAKFHEQNRILQEYLKLTSYANPFRNKERWTKSLLMNATFMNSTSFYNDSDMLQIDVDELFYRTVMIKYGFAYAPLVRFTMWERLCLDINSTLYDSVTCQKQGTHQRKLYAAASKYLFGFSPPGNGMDCYRTYEYLLLGVIPIVPDLPINWGGLFDDLPVLVLEDYNRNRTRGEYLVAMRDYIASPKFQDQDFEAGWKKLFLRYWRRLVLDAAGRKVIVDPTTGKEFYEGWKYTSTTNSPPLKLGVPEWFKETNQR